MVCAKRKCRGMLKLFLVVVLTIVLYWFFLLGAKGSEENAVHHDFMNQIVFEAPTNLFETCCSWWPVSHFIFFFIIGLLFPTCDVLAVTGGIAWELTEVGVYQTIGKKRQGVRKPGKTTIEYSQNWWAGSTKDIVMNIAGFYTGKILIGICGKKLCIDELENCECDK